MHYPRCSQPDYEYIDVARNDKNNNIRHELLTNNKKRQSYKSNIDIRNRHNYDELTKYNEMVR